VPVAEIPIGASEHEEGVPHAKWTYEHQYKFYHFFHIFSMSDGAYCSLELF